MTTHDNPAPAPAPPPRPSNRLGEVAPGQSITVWLPGEALRAEVIGVHENGHVSVRLGGIVMSKDHQWRVGDVVECYMRRTPIDVRWEPLPRSALS